MADKPCTICDNFTDAQREMLSPTYRMHKEKKNGVLVSPEDVTDFSVPSSILSSSFYSCASRGKYFLCYIEPFEGNIRPMGNSPGLKPCSHRDVFFLPPKQTLNQFPLTL